jgi:hypothetical protein
MFVPSHPKIFYPWNFHQLKQNRLQYMQIKNVGDILAYPTEILRYFSSHSVHFLVCRRREENITAFLIWIHSEPRNFAE